MPKPTFFNLPENKRKKLIEAAETEFSRVALSQASISNIVKAAGVPRGSFYQYFENKEDAFYYLLDVQAKERKEHFIASLKENDGDLFIAVTELFKMMLDDISQEKVHFLKNALIHVTHEVEDIFIKIFEDKQTSKDQLRQITDLINKENLNIKDEREFFHIMQIIVSVTFRNLVDKYHRSLSDEEAMENLGIEMKLLKNGLCK